MKITIDPDLLGGASRPLREATELAREVQRGSRSLAGYADSVGHPELSSAIGEFLGAWGRTLDAVARHGETMTRMVCLAGAGRQASPTGGGR